MGKENKSNHESAKSQHFGGYTQQFVIKKDCKNHKVNLVSLAN